MFPKWKNHEKISIQDLNIQIMEGQSRGHQEDARLHSVLEFVSLIRGDKKDSTGSSDFLNHKRSTMLLYATYQSAVLKRLGKNPLVNIPF